MDRIDIQIDVGRAIQGPGRRPLRGIILGNDPESRDRCTQHPIAALFRRARLLKCSDGPAPDSQVLRAVDGMRNDYGKRSHETWLLGAGLRSDSQETPYKRLRR